MALTPILTLSCTVPQSDRRLEDKYLTNLANFLRRLLDEKYAGKQRGRAEKELGISQSHLSQILRGPRATRGPGLRVVIKLHEATGVSIDEMLGISGRSAYEERLARLEQKFEKVAERHETPPHLRSGLRRKRG